MEADSLNASILGPDAVPGTPEFDLFVKEVAREMTVKAGQKCTAIRRVIAPRSLTDALVAALGDSSGEGHRRRPGERGRRAWVRSPALTSVKKFASGFASSPQEAEIVVGDPDRVTVASGDAGEGRLPQPDCPLFR